MLRHAGRKQPGVFCPCGFPALAEKLHGWDRRSQAAPAQAVESPMKKMLSSLLDPVELPRVFRYAQSFPDERLDDVSTALALAWEAATATRSVRPGMRVALSVGSRGIAQLPELVAAIAARVRACGAEPFVVPAMGSHGGATAEGQKALLAVLGVTEASVGCPVLSCMETVEVGRLSNGMSVRMDRLAQEADGIIVFNRVKPHNAFRAVNESGLVKMLAIGLGKQTGADQCHRLGFGHIGRLIREMAALKIERCPVLMGIGVVENAYEHLHSLFVAGPEEIVARDAEALQLARALMPCLPCGQLDLLLVDRIGKEFSGGGMDGNITGRYSTPFISGGPEISKIVVFDVTKASHGNANGVGLADVITEALAAHYDRASVYANCLTSRVTASGRLPVAMPDENMALRAGFKVCCAPDPARPRFLRIPDTLHIDRGYASEALLPELASLSRVQILSGPEPMRFGPDGRLEDPWW